MDAASAIAELVIANRVLAHLKLVDSFGHITIRNPENPRTYFISSSRAPALVTKEDIMEFDLDSNSVASSAMRSYVERFIHGRLYKARPDVVAVCHNHAHELLPMAVTKTVMRPVLHSAGVIGQEVPVWDSRDQFGDTDLLVSSNAMGDSLAATVGKGRAALMRGHGCVIAGSSLRDAVFTAYYLRLNAEVLVKAALLGREVTHLSPRETALAAEIHMLPNVQGRAWEEWCVQAGVANLPPK